MLLEFSVANYLSFKDRVTLSLVASKDTEHPENTFPLNDKSDLSLLKSVGIYGANASGKSNLINALRFMTRFVLTSASEMQRGDAIEVVPFKLDPKTISKPSEFELVFVVGHERYVYGFTADSKEVYEEWLTATRMTAARRKPRVLFERSPGTEIHFGDSWRGDRLKLEKVTRPNALFLSVAVQFDNLIARPVFDYFRNGIRWVSDMPETALEAFYTADRFLSDESFAEYIRRFMKAADLSIEGLSVEESPLRESERWAGLRKYIRQDILADLAEDEKEMLVRSLHRTSEGSEVTFDLNKEESAGTRRLFALAGPWCHVSDEGCILLVDELDAHLHPLMTRFLVKLIHSAKGTPQLIFTTHDTSVLDAELFRRDQIWFTEKDEFGATNLYSLWDYDIRDIRKDENFGKWYLTGRYGATPIIGGFAFGNGEK